MNITLGFDVYGTLIDTHGVILQLEKMIGDDAPGFSQAWREKQLEYTFRRGLMGRYQDFSVCTRQALEHTADTRNHDLSEQQKQTLLAAYFTLPVFADVVECLDSLKDTDMSLYAFSNGQAEAVNTALTNAGIRGYFEGVISVDSIGTFKPDPAVYEHFVNAANSDIDHAWLVSSNGFDVIGAIAYGIRAAWVQRSGSVVYDPWEFTPTVTLSTLADLCEVVS